MPCANCRTEAEAYTLSVHVADRDSVVDLPFCSRHCLAAWV